jgi:hypothetical protein
LIEGRCSVCRAVLGRKGASGEAAASLIERAARSLRGRDVEAFFAMPLASTRPQSAGYGRKWWVCAAVKPTRSRLVLLDGLGAEEAQAVAHALAARLDV